jgi:hypothetical protein
MENPPKKEMTAAEIEHMIFVRAQNNVEGTKLIEGYAKQEMIRLITNISRQPITCYSQKEKGKDKEFFLGQDYITKLISSINNNT